MGTRRSRALINISSVSDLELERVKVESTENTKSYAATRILIIG